MTDETVFAAALDIPDPARRAAYLDEACAGDPARRLRVAALLAAHNRAGDFLARPAVVPPDLGGGGTGTFGGAAGVEPADDALGLLRPSPRPGALGRIGHYDALAVLGRGGFGIVYRAVDDVLQRVVAVKVLAPALAVTSPARKRFLREARAAAAVRHDHVVQVYAVEEDPLPYLVMEFIPGETLQDRLDRTGPIDPPDAVRLGRQIAEGLAAAHARGLVHRDVKPGNVLIEAGVPGRAKLTDFGLARAADDASLTQSGVVAGTPVYMAPEQARGDPVDPRSDLFSLGSVLYVMLTGRPPFRAETTMAVLRRVVEDAPRPIREVIPEVPDGVCRVVERLHAKDPAARFQTAREVADLLAGCERALRAGGDLTALVPVPRPARRPRSRRFWAGGAAAAVGLAAGAAAGPWAVRYARDRGAVELAPDAGWVAVVIRRDGAVAGDRFGVADGPALDLPPGRYVFDPELASGRALDRWEVTTHDLVGSRAQAVSDRAATVEVPRGGRVTVRAVTRDAPRPPAPPPGPPDARMTTHDEVWAEAFERYVAALPTNHRVAAVEAELRRRNPEFGGTVRGETRDGEVVGLNIDAPKGVTDLAPVAALRHLRTLVLPTGVSDLSPLRGMPLEYVHAWVWKGDDLSPLRGMRLTYLNCGGGNGKVDLTVLRGMPLTELYLMETDAEDLSPLAGMPLRILGLRDTRVADLTPLRGLPLQNLNCQGTRVSDLRPLAGSALKILTVPNTRVADLTPVRGVPLEWLNCQATGVTDLRPVAGCPLKKLECDYVADRDAAVLRGVKTLETVNGRPVAEVLKNAGP